MVEEEGSFDHNLHRCEFLIGKEQVFEWFIFQDILVLGRSYKECAKHVQMVLRLLRVLGFIVNEKKCSLEPSTSFTYLGCRWNTEDWVVSLKEKRVFNIQKSALSLLSQDPVKVRDVARFLGRTQSAAGVVPLARLRTRAVLFEFCTVVSSPEDYFSSYTMSEEARQQLEVWSTLELDSCMPISFSGMKVVSLDTDASDFGYGWYWKGAIFSDELPEDWRGLHINVTELWTLSQFLETEGSELHDVVLCWRCDNNAALAAIKK